MKLCTLREGEVPTEVGAPGHQDGSVDGETVAAVAEHQVAAVLALVQVRQALTQGHRGRPEYIQVDFLFKSTIKVLSLIQ